MVSAFKADADLVFPTRTGRAQKGRNVSRRGLENALPDAKVPKMRFHDLRHTHCSLLISERGARTSHSSPIHTCGMPPCTRARRARP
jgi:integrase